MSVPFFLEVIIFKRWRMLVWCERVGCVIESPSKMLHAQSSIQESMSIILKRTGSARALSVAEIGRAHV